ncbi:MAG TPA: molybdopterin-dependent oxidoreductase [Propionibacterium sp.]|nr:molybdopterin-dependent oxidoreductase [Propionibacterium sp.]
MSTEKTNVQETPEPASDEPGWSFNRRTLLGATAGVAGTAAVVGMFREGFRDPLTQATPHGTGDLDDGYDPSDVIYSMCMQCNTFCTIKVRLGDGGDTGATALIRKIAGNPYSALTTQPLGPIPYDTTPNDAVRGLGTMATESRSRSGGLVCLKGQAGLQIAHDAKRITKPLRRVGPRGSGKWATITWEEALNDLLEGNSELGTPGLKEIWAYAPKKPVMDDWQRVTDDVMSLAEFETKWGDKLLDPKQPELGPRSNRIAMIGGDRMYLVGARFGLQQFGTINQFNHAGTCGVSGVVANARTHPTTNFQRMYADIDFCRYLVVWGTEPLTANKGPTWLAPRIGRARERGMKLVVVDPHLSKTAEKADTWLPVRPGNDAELAWAMIRWIIDNERYDERYLRQPNQAAANAVGEPTWSDATYLVNTSDPRRPYVTASDLGLAPPPEPDPETGKTPDGDPVCVVDGEPVGSADASGQADLDVELELTVNGEPIVAKTVFRLLTERAHEREIAEWAEAAGVDAATVEQVARDFTAHGKRACVMSYRGPAMHANGFDAVRAIAYLNFLIGNHDWKGGHITGQKGFSPRGGRYDLDEVENPNQAWGIPITREKARYEDSAFFARDGYPAKRRWYQFPGNLCHEVIPSAVAAYPYSLDALFIHRHSPMNSSPGGHRQAEQLHDTDKIKLLVSFDITVGDTSAHCDYILPDTSYLERFSQEAIYPTQQFAVTQLGQPTLRAFEGPRPVEWVYLELAKALGLPGVGKDAFGAGAHFETVEDYWLKIAANVAYAGGKPVPDANAEELRLFTDTRNKVLKDAWDERRWQAAVKPEEWAKVVYVLNRGGRFEGHGGPEYDNGYEGEWLKYRYEGLCAFYDPKVAAAKDPMTGENFDGMAAVREARRADGSPFPKEGTPLQLVGWKSRNQGTQRTVNAAWLREVRGSNYLHINPVDARPRGISTNDMVRIKSGTATVEGVAYVTEGIRPGVVGADVTYGHKGYFATPVEIDGTVVKPPAEYGHGKAAQAVTPGHEETGFAGPRSAGFAMNVLLADDTVLAGGGVSDPIGGGAAQLDTWVEVSKL